MAFDVNNPYFRNEVLTATPEKLRLLLLDGCVHFIAEGRAGLETKNHEAVYTNFSQARDILVELISGMDRTANPEYCDKLAALYTFVFKHLTEASFEKNAAKADECARIMKYERETWAMLMEKAAAERGAGVGAGAGTTQPGAAQPGAAQVGAAGVPSKTEGEGAARPAAPAAPAAPMKATGTYGPPARRPNAGGVSFSA